MPIELQILNNSPIPLGAPDCDGSTLSVGSGVTEGRLQEVLQDYIPKSDIDTTLSISGDVAESKTVGDILNAYAKIFANGWSKNDWGAVKALLDVGMLQKAYPVGAQITDKWYKTASTSYDAKWDIVNYNANGDVVVKWHYATPDGMAFDEPEALYYADGTETAGSYYIKIGNNYGSGGVNGWVKDKCIQFTFTADLAEGDQLVIATNKDSKTDVLDVDWTVYGAGSTTAKQTGHTSEGNTGTLLGTVGTNIHRTEGRLNAPSRVVYGYNRWSQSAIRQWLNSDGPAGSWWTMQNPWDRPSALNARGFLAGLSADLLSIIAPTRVRVALNTVEEGLPDFEETEDLIYLPAMENMYIVPQYEEEAEAWDYYKTLSAEAGREDRYELYGTYPELITYRVDSPTSAAYVWLRSCARGNATNAGAINTTGGVRNSYASVTFCACPACTIKKSV